MSEDFTGIALVTFVFGSFILFAILKIKNGIKGMRATDKSKTYRNLKRLDVIFSSIFLFFYDIFFAVSYLGNFQQQHTITLCKSHEILGVFDRFFTGVYQKTSCLIV